MAVVNRVFGGGDDWKAAVRANLQLDESLDEHIRQMWARNQEIASQTGQILTPMDFAKMVVDENFSSLIAQVLNRMIAAASRSAQDAARACRCEF